MASLGCHLRDGQTVHFFIEAGKDVYVGLWNVTDKRTIRLFPNEDEEDNFLPTGTARRVPGSQAESVARHSVIFASNSLTKWVAFSTGGTASNCGCRGCRSSLRPPW